MKILYKGSQTEERLKILLLACKSEIRSNDIKAALHYFLVKGANKTYAAAINNVPGGNLTRALKKLEEKAQLFEQLKEHDHNLTLKALNQR